MKKERGGSLQLGKFGFCRSNVWKVSKRGHGPKRKLKWHEVATLNCCTGNSTPGVRRLWIYTRWGAFFFDYPSK